MDEAVPHSIRHRRAFLKLLAAAGVTSAGGYLLSEYSPWLDYDAYAARNRSPIEKGPETQVQMLELVRYATLAANGHNTQPWKFSVKKDSIAIYPDAHRRLKIVDPEDRELWISLGCALENMLVAAQAVGYSADVVYPEKVNYIQLYFYAQRPKPTPLFGAILPRQNNRSEYDGQELSANEFESIQTVVTEPGVTFVYMLTPQEIDTAAEYVYQGTLSQYEQREFVDELVSWLRFNRKEAISSLDGLFTPCTGNIEVPRWVGELVMSALEPQKQADNDTRLLRSSSGVVVIASDGDDIGSWIRTGQVYERLALKMTSMDIQSAFLNQPVEVPALRGEFQQAIGLTAYRPQLLLRFGHANPMPFSLRRSVEQVILKTEV